MKNTYRPGEEWNKAYLPGTAQARFRVLEGKPFIEQADAVAPLFEVLTVFQGPVQVGADSGTGNPAVVRPAHERRIGIEDQLRTWKMCFHCQHQRFDLSFFKVHEDALGQKKNRTLAMGTHFI